MHYANSKKPACRLVFHALALVLGACGGDGFSRGEFVVDGGVQPSAPGESEAATPDDGVGGATDPSATTPDGGASRVARADSGAAEGPSAAVVDGGGTADGAPRGEVSPEPAPAPFVSVTATGSVGASTNYRLFLSAGAPAPVGATTPASGYRLSLSPPTAAR